MAKDRRGKASANSPYDKAMRYRWLGGGILVVAGLLMIVLSVTLGHPSAPTDGTPTVTTTTVNTADTTTAVTTAATTAVTVTDTTTVAVTEATTTTTVAATTTTVATTTTTTAPAVYEGDGVWNRILINPWHPWTAAELDAQTDIVWYSGSESVDSRIADPLTDMLVAGSQYGLWVCSGYRSYETQEILFNREVDEVLSMQDCTRAEAEAIAATVVARPGTSEHHTGLAVDLLHSDCWELEEYWDQSAAFDWMMEHCAEYGFILRYPKDKQHITGVIYEPWHYRYVGVEAATEIMSRGITLEEYLQG